MTARHPTSRRPAWRIGAGLALGSALLLALLAAAPPCVRAQAPAVAPAAPANAPPATIITPQGGPGFVPAGQAPPPGAGAPGTISLRVELPIVDLMSFTTHPFYQITEDPAYANAKALTTSLLDFHTRATDENAGVLPRLLDSLPPFGLEWVMGLDLGFPRGLGWGFDFTPLSQTDVQAVEGGMVTPIAMNAYLYTALLRVYFFDPSQPGVNYFVGVGLGFLQGKIKATVGTATPQFISFSQYPVGSTRLGLETRGDHWGFRYELALINADQVTLDSNPYPDLNGDGKVATKLDLSGALVRITFYYQL
jgi:hypothetical protein